MDAQCADSYTPVKVPESSTSSAQAVEAKEQRSSVATNTVQLLPPLSSLPTNESLDLQRTYSCGICFDAFTKETRYPVSLNCGHSFCVICIKKMNGKKTSIMCGVCRKHTFSSHKRLGKNFLLIDILEKNGLLGVEEEKKSTDKEKGRQTVTSRSDDWEDNTENTDSTFEEDESQYGRAAAYNSDFNSFSIAVDEIEEFHDQLESIQDLLYGLDRGVPRNDDFDRQLEELRSDMGRVEQKMRSDRASFRNIAARSRQLYQLVRQTGNAASQPTNDNAQQESSGQNSHYSSLRNWLSNHFIGTSSGGQGTDAEIYGGQGVDEDPFSAPSEEEWGTSGEDETREGFAVARAAIENRIVAFLSGNFIKVRNRSSDNVHINQVECYLCNVVIQYSYYNAIEHINGRRHREYIRVNQSSPSQITEAGVVSSIQPTQNNTLTWDMDEEEWPSEPEHDRDILLRALQTGNAFELDNIENPHNFWADSENDAPSSPTSRTIVWPQAQSSLHEVPQPPNASGFPFSSFGSNSSNDPASFGGRARREFGRGYYFGRGLSRPAQYIPPSSRNQPVVEEEVNNDWDECTTNSTPFLPQPESDRATTASSGSQPSARPTHGSTDANRPVFGIARRALGFANSTANNSTTSRGFSSGRFGSQLPRTSQYDQTYTSLDLQPDSNLPALRSVSNQAGQREEKPETSRPITQHQAPVKWGEFLNRESLPSRTRRRSRNSNNSNTSPSTGNRKARQQVRDGQRNRNNFWSNGQTSNNSSPLNSITVRNIGNNQGSWPDYEEQDHPTQLKTDQPRHSSSNTSYPSTTDGRQNIRFREGDCNSRRDGCHCTGGSARTEGTAFRGRFGRNTRRGNNQIGVQESSNHENRNLDRSGRQSMGGRFSSSDWK